MERGRTTTRTAHPVHEFSDSYHLLAPDPDEAGRLLRRAGRFGAVLPATGRFIAFLVEGLAEAGDPQGAVVAQNSGTLVHYAFAEETGCRVRVFGGSALLVSLHVTTDTSPSHILESSAILRGRGVIDDHGAALLVDVAPQPNVRDAGPRVAAALGLSHTPQLSCADLTYGWTTLPRRYPGLRFVNKAKRVGGPPDALIMALPVPEATLDPEQETLVRRHYRYWAEFGDFDNETSSGYWMYERYRAVLPSRFQYLCARLWKIHTDRTRVLDTSATIRAIIALAGPQVDWEQTLRGF
jgi:hypothetical protein